MLIPPHRTDRFEYVPVPDGLQAVLVRPEIRLDTEAGRGMLSNACALSDVVRQTANLASFLSACYTNNIDRVADVLQDVLVEPQRCHQVAGFTEIRDHALAKGALGFALSGSGPSMVAWCRSEQADVIELALRSTMAKYHSQFQVINSPVGAPGAQLIDTGQWLGSSPPLGIAQ